MNPIKKSVTNSKLLPLLEVIELFRKFDKEIPAQVISTYLYVATHDKCHKVALQEELGYSSASASRNSDFLSPTHRLKKKGFSLLNKYFDPSDKRLAVLELSEDGKKLMYELMSILYDPFRNNKKEFSTKFLEEKEIKSEKEKDIKSLMEKYKDIDPELLRKALSGSNK